MNKREAEAMIADALRHKSRAANIEINCRTLSHVANGDMTHGGYMWSVTVRRHLPGHREAYAIGSSLAEAAGRVTREIAGWRELEEVSAIEVDPFAEGGLDATP